MNTAALDEEKFNLEIRKFLKVVGITSQREIEQAIREAVAAGRLATRRRGGCPGDARSCPELGVRSGDLGSS
jgi:hypothetical protein